MHWQHVNFLMSWRKWTLNVTGWNSFLCLPKIGQTVEFSLLSEFFPFCYSLHIFRLYIALLALTQTLNPCETCLPLYLQSFTALLLTIMSLFKVSWEFKGIPPIATYLTLWQPVITRVSLITTPVFSLKVKKKNPFPIYCFSSLVVHRVITMTDSDISFSTSILL